MSNRLDKSPYFYCMLGNPKASFGTISADLHRIRRSALNPFFSQQAVSKFSSHVQAIVDRFMHRIETCAERGESIPLSYAYRCVTVDIITEYIFGHQFKLLDRADWGKEFYSAWRSLWELSPTIRQFPWMMDAFMAMPRWFTALTNPKALEVVDLFSNVDEQTKTLLTSNPKEIESKQHPVVIWELSKTDILSQSEKTFSRLAVEANGLLAAGFETTGSILTHTTYLILAHPDAHRKLLVELMEAIPNPGQIPSFQNLEKLPYLGAVVKEGLRLAVGAWSRLPRVNRSEDMQYRNWVIPAGTEIGMSALFISKNPLLFPDPESFKPERWLSVNPSDDRLEQYILAFGKGTRSCVGINLAYAEMYTILATLFRKFPQLQLHNTTARDVEHVHDYFAGMTRAGSHGLQVIVGK
ncbi:putative cytochrome P450 [Talaromyces proteolyticus]|uniref:Cytochrome P450 n=1 Tax=Talaromyces proteolyticus TaxID=1131652 RepID=A0AAD4KMN4_9EURO|nr:putative cytochrome P450 [Talaromyces proteolyticus]KAH8696252.1 putative cytochrome P450 [Talaromyces proteolyticus]